MVRSIDTREINANAVILILAIVFDVLVLAAFLWIKAQTDMMIIYAAIIGMLAIFVGERIFLRRTKASIIYKRTKNLRAVQILLGHTKLESSVRYLDIEVDDALELVEQTEV